MGFDDVCRVCPSYDSQTGCIDHSETQLMFEDQRTLEGIFSHLIPHVVSEQPVYLCDIVQ